MNDRAVALLEQYEIEVLRTRKGRGAILCDTQQGCLIFKEYTGREEQLRLQEQVLKHLEERGTVSAERLLATKEGALSVTDRDGVRYILKTWWEGRECNIRDREECMEAMRLLARLHGDLEFTPVFPETEETSAPVIERYLPSRDYEKHNRELKRARRFLKQRSQKTWFEIRLSAVIDPFLEEARQLCEEWKEIELAASDSGEEVPLCFCHGDYQYHNILRQDRGFFLVNFEKCQADGPVRDLYLLLRKLLEKSEWDAEWGRVLLAAYESVRPLKPYERQDLFYRLSYPEKLWKIVNFYYNSGKAWIPEKNQEKLDRLLEQEAARKKFLKLLQREKPGNERQTTEETLRQDRSVRRQRRSKNVEKIRRQKVFENETDSGKSFACDSNVICWLRAGSVPRSGYRGADDIHTCCNRTGRADRYRLCCHQSGQL